MTDDPSPGSAEVVVAAAAAPLRVTGRFTPADGLRGWNQARSRKLLCYGPGSIEIAGSRFMLQGWQRTWLGAPIENEFSLTSDRLRNVVRAGALVRFEGQVGRRWRVVEFTAESEADAIAVAAALPATRSPGFMEAWTALQDYEQRIGALPGRCWVTPALVVANLAAFVTSLILSQWFAPGLSELIRLGANAGELTTHGEWWRLLTATFLHVGLAHVGLNLWALWNAGRLAERLYGSATYLAIYLTSGVLASLTSTVWNPTLMSVGASGAIFGVLGALLAFVMRGDGVPASIVRAHFWSTLFFVAFNLVVGALNPLVDNAAHVGGLVSGFLLGLLLRRRLDVAGPQPVPALRMAGASALTAIALAAGVTYIRAPVPDPSGPYAWTRQASWYVDQESAQLRRLATLAIQWQAGVISASAYSEAIRGDILPFLETAEKRLATTVPAPRGGPPAYRTLALDYVTARKTWLEALAAALEHDNADSNARAESLRRKADETEARLMLARQREQLDGRRTGISHSFATAWRRFTNEASLECVAPPPSFHYVAIAADARGDGPAIRKAAGCEAQRLFMYGRYGMLEDRLNASFRHLDDLPDGGSTFAGIEGGLGDLFEYGSLNAVELPAQFAEWRDAYPHSAYPDLFEALFYRESAWAARGGGFATSVSAQVWQVFRQRTAIAVAALDGATPEAKNHPMWYELSIATALDSSKSLEEIRSVYDAGAARFPSYQPLSRSMLRVLLPRWEGSTEEIVEFIDRLSFQASDATYARLNWSYAWLEGDDGDIFEGGRISWPRIQSGFRELLRDHPTSDYLLNAYASLACRKGDAQTYGQLRPETARRPSSTAWSEKLSMAECDRKFAAADGETGSAPIAPVGSHTDIRGNVVTDADARWV